MVKKRSIRKMNFISIANKIGKRARKEALAFAEKEGYARYETFEREEVQQWINERSRELYQVQFDKQVKELDQDLTQAFKADGLIDVLNKHGFKMKKGNDKISGKWFFITLRPEKKHEHRFNDFKQEVMEYLKRTMFIDWTMVFEQKGETEETLGEGYHCHILSRCADWATKQKMINDTKSTWKKWLNGDVPDAFVQIDKVETTTDHDNKIKYMSGDKADEWKQKAVEMDILFREKYHLEKLYKPSLPRPGDGSN